MARLWTSGFELQSATANVEVPSVGGTLAFSTSTFRTGAAALDINVTAGTGFMRVATHTSNQSTVTYVRVYLQVTATLPAAGTPATVVGFQNAAFSSCGSISLVSTGKLRLLSANGTQIGSDSTTVLSAGQWYRIELKLDASSSPGSLDAQIDGVSFASGANNAQSPWFGSIIGITSTATARYYLDDWAHNDNSGSSQTSWPGAGNVIYLRPNGSGDANAWLDTAGSAGTTNNYTLVDETTPNTTTDMIQAGALNTEDLYNLSASGINSYDTVNVVHVGAHFRTQTSTSVAGFKFEIEKTSGGTKSQSAALVPASTTWKSNAIAAPFTYPITLYADPDGAAWTSSTLDTAQAGVIITTAEANTSRRAQISTIWVVVDYTPGTPPPAPVAEVYNYTMSAVRQAATW